MTVASETNKVLYNGNGSTTVFAYTFLIFDDDDLLVQLKDTTTGVITTQTKTTHYTVSGVDASSGGNVTFVTAPASGNTVIISRDVSYTQETDYNEYDSFPAETHEEALDRATMQSQQLKETADRSLKIDSAVTGFDVTLPTPVANALISVNSDNDGLELVTLADVAVYSFPAGTTGILVQTDDAVAVTRSLAAPAAGFTITNPAGLAGNFTFVLTNDLAALEGLSSTGFAVRTATDTWAQRTLTGTANEITVTNGNGISGNPVFSLPAALTFTSKTVTGGTYASPTFSGTVAGSYTVSGTITMTGAFANTSLRILDTNASHALIIKPGSDITADRTLTVTTGDADRTVTLSGNLTVSSAATVSGTNTGDVSAASQAEQEAASSTTVYTSPGTQTYHPGNCKVWGRITLSGGTPSLSGGYNISSVTDIGVGSTRANFSITLSGTSTISWLMCPVVSDITCAVNGSATTSITVGTRSVAATPADTDASFSLGVFGDI